MNKSIILLLLCFFGPFYAVESMNTEPGTSAAQERASVIDLQPGESLAKIDRSEVLPLIIIINHIKYPHEYRIPEKLLQYNLPGGKISNVTEFAATAWGEQIFLCPRDRDNSQNKCLARKTFGGSEQLRCDSEPLPIWITDHRRCRKNNDDAQLFHAAYKVCEDDELPDDPPFVLFYEICYDKKLHKTLYTRHEIMSPALWKLKLLTREREIDYTDVISDEPTFSQHSISKDDLMKEESNSKTSSYQLQKMVPAEDMAFATWRRTTFNNLNYEWQHKDLVDLWDEISNNIRSVIKNYVSSADEIFFANTAIVGEPLSNIWVKMVILVQPDITKTLQFKRGIVILMNNFINKSKSFDSGSASLKEYCDDNLCIEELSKKFNDIGGAVRCCLPTPQILSIFAVEADGEMKELRIPNVTVTEDQEIREFDDSITSAKTALSLREIQRNEILPLIVHISDDSDQLPFEFPATIHTIETKNQRIVQGSKFFTKSQRVCKLFCPKEDSKDECLVAKQFGRHEPLQCVEEAIPIVRKMEGQDAKCGLERGGVIHKVVYEICSTKESRSVDVEFYKVCYDEGKGRSLYTHHEVLSQQLIFSDLLLRERAIDNFTMIEDISDTKAGYKLQKLIPSKDMAFGLWKKTTYRRINTDWQHEELISRWNEINDLIRDHYLWQEKTPQFDIIPPEFLGIKKSRNHRPAFRLENYVYTGVFDLQYESKSPTDDQESSIWIKIIVTYRTFYREALVILMNNFLVPAPRSISSDAKENLLWEYCPKSLCSIGIEKKFENINGRVGGIHCCPLNKKIAELFGHDVINLVETISKVMYIRGITKSEEELALSGIDNAAINPV